MARQEPENVEVEVDSDELTLRVDLSQDLHRATKTVVVATSHGNQRVDDDEHRRYYWTLNVFRYPDG